MVIDCSDPENKDKPECKIDYEKEKKLSANLLSIDCEDPKNIDKPECKIERKVEDEIKKVENKEVCNRLEGIYNEQDNSCLVPKMNYLSLNLNSFDDVVGKPYRQLINRLKYEIATGLISNQLFDGPTGMAKSQIARLIPREYAKSKGVDPDEFERYNVKEISGSDKLGVDFIRNQVVNFVRTHGYVGDKKFLIIDEADRLTPEAQDELKHLITEEIPKHGNKTVIIFTTNDMSKMDPTLVKSRRFQVEEFRPLDDKDMLDMYQEFSVQTGIKLADEEVKEAIAYSGGSPGNLLANMYRIHAGESPYDYSLNEYTLKKEREKLELEEQKIQNEQKAIEKELEKERVEAKKWALENLYNYNNDEILAGLTDRADIPPEMKKEREKNILALRELYMMKNNVTPNQLENKIKEYLRQRSPSSRRQTIYISQDYQNTGYGEEGYEGNEENQPQEEGISLDIPDEITYEYGGKIRKITHETQGAQKYLKLWALAREAELTHNPDLDTQVYWMRKSLVAEGNPESAVRAIIKSGRDSAHQNQNNTNQ